MNRVYFLHIWRMRNGNLAMVEIAGMSFHRMKEFYDYHLAVVGRTATVHCFFSDYDIRDEELKNMSTAFMKGNYIESSVNLDNGEIVQKMGIPRVHPRQ